jgi:thiol:disulfide interchange protein DsbD
MLYSFGANATKSRLPHPVAPVTGVELPGKDAHTPQKTCPALPCQLTTDSGYRFNEFSATQPANNMNIRSVLWLFIQSLIAGLLAVFTPYVYTIHPFTTGYLARNARSAGEKMMKSLIYALSLILILTLLGFIVFLIIKFTGVGKFTEHWIFNLFFCRTFVILGITFLGGFSIKLPESWIDSLAKKAKSNNLKGIIIMAITLPGASFSSTFPIIGIVLLFACNVGVLGPVIGLFGFGVGLSLPFVFPGMLSFFIRSKSVLNSIKITMGFLSLMIALKFASKADVALGTNLIDRGLFIVIWMMMWALMGVYMLGLIKLSNDTETEHNLYGQEYISLSRLFISIASFVFALYLLPGIWGAPLHGVSGFLP